MQILYDGKVEKLNKAMKKGSFFMQENQRPLTYVQENGRNHGPYDLEQLRALLIQGNISSDDWASYNGQNWVRIAEVPGLLQPITDHVVIERTDFNYWVGKIFIYSFAVISLLGAFLYTLIKTFGN
ncbi:MAG: hypothetical protein CMI31_09595 [Opitutae bacterium]|nr:hypothetical protein [Opitutae bacterium]|tara:strand:+ start:462 stop:839 length:378 start_codon:yes stop_codon:yes gene_type:complete